MNEEQMDQTKKRLSFLYIAREELIEARRYAAAQLKSEWFINGGQHESPEVKALDLSLIISYARPFKQNYGFGNVQDLLDEASKHFDSEETSLHDEIIALRDQEYAHSDAEANDVDIYLDDMFEYSKKVIRVPLDRTMVNHISQMVGKLVASFDKQINELRQELLKIKT